MVSGIATVLATHKARRRKTFIYGALALVLVVGLWLANGLLLFSSLKADDLFGERGTFGDMFGTVNSLFSGLGFVGLVIAIVLQQQEIAESRDQFSASYEEERRVHTKETADTLFREWWGPELIALRRYFYAEFLPLHYARSVGNGYGLKDLEQKVPSDHGRLQALTGYFDRVGWLAAAGLVDVDYILGPMQHAMRRVWIVTEPLITATRASRSPGWLDPVYRFGFEWLYRRSQESGKAQHELIQSRFSDPLLLDDTRIGDVTTAIRQDEREFRAYLKRLQHQPHVPTPSPSRTHWPTLLSAASIVLVIAHLLRRKERPNNALQRTRSARR